MKYSIIVPACNSEETIDRCINAILDSKFNEKFELIVVDDGCRDNTANIAKGLGAMVVENNRRGNPARARNAGSRYAKGEALVFVDSDVLLFPDTLQKIDNFFNNEKEFSAISCSYDPRCEMTDSISRYKHLYTSYILLNQPKIMSWAFTSTFAIKRDVFESMGGFNEKVDMFEDDLLGRGLVDRGYKIALGKEILIKHLHRYTFSDFVKMEFKRSRVFTAIKLTGLLKKTAPIKKNVGGHMVYSILVFPFLLVGFLLSPIRLLFLIIALCAFYSINFNFLRFCKKKIGIKFMLQAALIIPLDCLACIAGIISGIFDFLKGKRI